MSLFSIAGVVDVLGMTSLRRFALVVTLASGCTTNTSNQSESVQSRACLDHAPNPYNVEVTGSGFSDVSSIHALTDIRLVSAVDVTCRLTAAVQVNAGSFSVELANVTDTASYPFVGAFIDLDGDGACSAADLTWGTYGETVDPGFAVEVTLAQFAAGDPGKICGHFASVP